MSTRARWSWPTCSPSSTPCRGCSSSSFTVCCRRRYGFAPQRLFDRLTAVESKSLSSSEIVDSLVSHRCVRSTENVCALIAAAGKVLTAPSALERAPPLVLRDATLLAHRCCETSLLPFLLTLFTSISLSPWQSLI